MRNKLRVPPKDAPERDAASLLAAVRSANRWVFECTADGSALRWLAPTNGTLLGRSLDAPAALVTWREWVHPDDLLSLGIALRRACEPNPGSVSVELRLRHVDGSWHWLEVRAANDCPDRSGNWVGIVEDISERKRIESQLALAGLMLELIDDAVLVTGSDGGIRWANSAAATLFELPIGELTTRNLAEFSAETRVRELELQQQLRDAVEASGLWRARTQCCTASGVDFPVAATVSRVQGDDDKLWIHVRRDLRERVQLQQAAIDSSQREQARLGRLLYESVGQELAAAAMLLRGTRRSLGPDAMSQVDEVDAMLRRSIARCRDLADGLPNFVLGRRGFAQALGDLVQWARERGAGRVELLLDESARGLTGAAANLVHRVVGAALADATEFLPGANIDIRIAQAPDSLFVTVTDSVHRDTLSKTLLANKTWASELEALGAQIEFLGTTQGGQRVVLEIPERSLENSAARRALHA